MGGIDSPSDLDWEGLGKYGAGSEAGGYLVSRDGACDYGDIGNPAEIDAYKVFAKENVEKEKTWREGPTFKQFRAKIQRSKPKTGFLKMKSNLGKGERKQNFDERQARLERVGGDSLKGGFAQRRPGCCKT